jgi:hypothetical protein
MNVQILIRSCKMITDLTFCIQCVLSSYYCMTEMSVVSLVFMWDLVVICWSCTVIFNLWLRHVKRVHGHNACDA